MTLSGYAPGNAAASNPEPAATTETVAVVPEVVEEKADKVREEVTAIYRQSLRKWIQQRARKVSKVPEVLGMTGSGTPYDEGWRRPISTRVPVTNIHVTITESKSRSNVA